MQYQSLGLTASFRLYDFFTLLLTDKMIFDFQDFYSLTKTESKTTPEKKKAPESTPEKKVKPGAAVTTPSKTGTTVTSPPKAGTKVTSPSKSSDPSQGTFY